MRFLILLLVVSAATTGFAASNAGLDEARKIDPIVTGVQISKAQKENWRAQKAAYVACKECTLDQPFPGDMVNGD